MLKKYLKIINLKFRAFLLYLLRFWLQFIFIGKNVYVVNGLRRSGNHAFINWFVNALESKSVTLNSLDFHIYQSDSGKTIFFNEMNVYGHENLLLESLIRTKEIWNANNVILSYEDVYHEYYSPLIASNYKKIAIKRSILNLIASRIHIAVKRAKAGADKGDMGIRSEFVEIYNFINNAEGQDYAVWDYDKWLAEPDFRSSFLNRFNLDYDEMPNISEQGGGSSFSGRKNVPQGDDLSSRWKQVEWPSRVLDLLIKGNVLTEDELEIVQALKDKENV